MNGCIILSKDDISFRPSSGRPSYGNSGITHYRIILKIPNPSNENTVSYIEFESNTEYTMEKCLTFRDDMLGLRQA